MENKPTKQSEMLERVIIFLIIFVGAIFVFTQYNMLKILEGSLLNYVSMLLILALIGLVAWMFLIPSKEGHTGINSHEPKAEKKPWTFYDKVTFSLISVIALMILFNQAQLSQASSLAGIKSKPLVNFGSLSFSKSDKQAVKLTGDPVQDAIALLPKGTPFYGEELGVTFDDPIKGLEITAQLDPSYGRNKVSLDAVQKERYIKILTTPTITCEFCCGVKTAVTKEGRPTCGCKHSWSTRGLTAYLIKNYPDLTDEQIMQASSQWKMLFFPKQMIARAAQEMQSGQYTPDIASLLLDVDEKKLAEMKSAVASSGASGEGADTQASVDSIDNLPNMVGGC
ncbi:MAG TPA: hypothetical protein VI564_04675 [Candidatus Nanoarchaeia archaeon]|nr:hypothetical protein [Candidatus Nanoarchaeia archaeon]